MTQTSPTAASDRASLPVDSVQLCVVDRCMRRLHHLAPTPAMLAAPPTRDFTHPPGW